VSKQQAFRTYFEREAQLGTKLIDTTYTDGWNAMTFLDLFLLKNINMFAQLL